MTYDLLSLDQVTYDVLSWNQAYGFEIPATKCSPFSKSTAEFRTFLRFDAEGAGCRFHSIRQSKIVINVLHVSWPCVAQTEAAMSHISHFEAQERIEEETRRRQSEVFGPTAVLAKTRKVSPKKKRYSIVRPRDERPDISNGEKNVPGTPVQGEIWQFFSPVICKNQRRKSVLTEKSHLRSTPNTRRVSYLPTDIVVDVEDKEHAKEAISKIIYRNWHVYRVSPMSNSIEKLEYRNKWLLNLEESVRDLKLTKNDVNDKNRKISATASEVKGLRGCAEDKEALNIHIFQGNNLLFEAFLLSIDGNVKMNMEEADAAVYPVLLIKGIKSIQLAFCASLRATFNCDLISLTLGHLEMMWASAMWIGLQVSESGESEQKADSSHQDLESDEEESGPINGNTQSPKDVKFIYTTSGKDTVTLEFSFVQSELVLLWQSMHDEKDNEATVLEVQAFHTAILRHVNRSILMQLKNLTLKKVILPTLTLNSSGQICIRTIEHAKTFLRFLTDVCQLQLESLDPPLAIPDEESMF